MRFVILSLTALFLMAGCTTLKDMPKGFAGISTRVLEEGRAQAITKPFNYNADVCYAKSKAILVKLGAYIYAQNKRKNMIAVYLSEQDTTPVGIFFTKIDENSTKVEVSSPSTYAKEYIAPRIFSALTKDYVK